MQTHQSLPLITWPNVAIPQIRNNEIIESKILLFCPGGHQRAEGDDKSSFALFAHPTRYTQLVNRADTPLARISAAVTYIHC